MRKSLIWAAAAAIAALLGTAAWSLSGGGLPPMTGESRDWQPQWTADALLVVGVILGVLFARRPRLGALPSVLLGGLAMAPVSVGRAAEIAADLVSDPTSHNLWPFEFAIIAVVGVAPCVAGIFAGRGLVWAWTRPRAS